MKQVCLFLLLLLLGAPALQMRLRWFEEPPLAGAYVAVPEPQLSWQSVVGNTYQPALEAYLESQAGFRSWLILLRNQLSFSLLGVARSSDIVVGRDAVLYQPSPVASYLGKDFLGEKEIQYRVKRMYVVQTELAKRGIPFLFVLAPNKARYQPEDLPAYVRATKRGVTNYDVFTQEMQRNGVNLLNISNLFRQWKDTTRYPLFPKGGTHWSGYGAMLTADTLFARIEYMSKLRLAKFRRTSFVSVTRDTLRLTDNDLSAPLNLLVPYQPYQMAYPRVVIDSLQPGQQRPDMLISGDSFVWAFMQFAPYLQTLFAPTSRFWGVDETVFFYDPLYKRTYEEVDQLNFRQQVESRQFIMMLVTEHNLIYDRFINRLYELYHPLTDADAARIKSITQDLLRRPGFSDSLWIRANQENRDFNDLLYSQARGIYDRTER